MRSTAFLENELCTIAGIEGIGGMKHMRRPHPSYHRACDAAWKFLLPISIYSAKICVGEGKSASAAPSSVML